MKTILNLILVSLLISICGIRSSGQKVMMLNNELKSSSTAMEAKRKGISTVGKYQFGPYKIVSGKAGWTITDSRSRFFSFETESESHKKSFFVFIANDRDTVLVNTSTNTKAVTTEIGDWSSLNQSNANFSALLSSKTDKVDWKLILSETSGENVQGNFQASGILSNDEKKIEIRPVKQWDNGNTATFKMIIGYEFYLDGKSIGAVQTSIDTFKKKFVWLNQELKEEMKTILAAASASIMVYVDETMAE